jgi:hypothetical protein
MARLFPKRPLKKKTYTCEGPGGGVSPKGQVVSMPVYVWVNFLKFIILRYQ